MNRRSFMGLAGAAMPAFAAGASEADSKTFRTYMLWQMFLKNGSQPQRAHDYLKNALIPYFKRAKAGPVLVMEALVAPHMPQIAVIIGYKSLADLAETHAASEKDEALMKVHEQWDRDNEPNAESHSSMVLQATDFSPELVIDKEPRKAQRIFELRTYHSPSAHQLQALNERFAGPEIKIFHRSGVHPILYTNTIIGPNVPNLTYVIPFDNLDAREKAWNAFGADPEWIKVRRESIEKSGQISSVIQISLWKATPYSPVG
jgi:hypothetical protein